MLLLSPTFFAPIILLACTIATVASVFYFILRKPNVKKIAQFFLIVMMDAFYIITVAPAFFKLSRTVDGDVSPFHGNYIPFKTITEYIMTGNKVQIFGNILITVPILFLIALSFRKLTFKKSFLISLIVTLSIEPIQLIINLVLNSSANIIDIDDLILNLIGCMMGALLAKFILSFDGKGKKSDREAEIRAEMETK
jgi:glycopeptide antibiotics resistance protein